MERHERKYSVLTHTLDPWDAVKRGQIFFFSESGHVAYQMKGKEVLIDMQEKAST